MVASLDLDSVTAIGIARFGTTIRFGLLQADDLECGIELDKVAKLQIENQTIDSCGASYVWPCKGNETYPAAQALDGKISERMTNMKP